MPLKIFDTTDAIPETLRASAIETKDGKFAISEDEDTGGLKSALEKERKAVKDAVKRAKELEDRTAALETEREAFKAGVKPEELQKLRTQIEGEYKTKLSEAEKQIHELSFGAQLDAAMAAADVIDLADGRALFGSRFEMVEGKLVPKDDKSITPQQYLASKLQAEKPHLFKGTQAEGGGAGGSRTAGAAAGDNVFKWTETQRAEFIQKHGYEAYNAKLNASALAQATTPQKAAA